MKHIGSICARYVYGGAVFRNDAAALTALEKYLGDAKTALPIIEGKISCVMENFRDNKKRCLSVFMPLRCGENLNIFRNDLANGFVTISLQHSAAPRLGLFTDQLVARNKHGYRSLVSTAAIASVVSEDGEARIDLNVFLGKCDETLLGGNTAEKIATHLVYNQTERASKVLLGHVKDSQQGAYSVVCECRHMSDLSSPESGILAARIPMESDATVSIVFYPCSETSPKAIESTNKDLADLLQEKAKLARDALRLAIQRHKTHCM